MHIKIVKLAILRRFKASLALFVRELVHDEAEPAITQAMVNTATQPH